MDRGDCRDCFIFVIMKNIFRAGLFSGHVAIVTGGGSGIGLAISKSLGQLGANIAICGRNEERLDSGVEILKKQGISAFGAACDIRNQEQIAAFVGKVKDAFGPATILVNNAGGQFPSAAENITQNGWESVIKNNLTGTFLMTQAVAVQHMMPAKRGRVLNITANVRRGFPAMAHTGAARAGVENMTKTLAIEWAQHNIQVNALAPGTILSTGTDQYPQELIETQRKNTPAKRFGTVTEVAMLATYMVSDAASYMTGELIYQDGGANLWGAAWPIPDHDNSQPPDFGEHE